MSHRKVREESFLASIKEIEATQFDFEEIRAVLEHVDRATPGSQRDHVILATMFRTGARVQEIIDLRFSNCWV